MLPIKCFSIWAKAKSEKSPFKRATDSLRALTSTAHKWAREESIDLIEQILNAEGVREFERRATPWVKESRSLHQNSERVCTLFMMKSTRVVIETLANPFRVNFCLPHSYPGHCPGLQFDNAFGVNLHSLTPRKRRALAMTETELKLIAAAASMGLNSRPKNG